MLKKEFNYLERFPTLKDNTFGNLDEKIKYFGLEPDTKQDASKNVEILFYNSFAFPEFYVGLIISLIMIVIYFCIDKIVKE